MQDADRSVALRVSVGGLSRRELRAALDASGVRLNDSADQLLDSTAFDRQRRESFSVVRRTVAQLGFGEGATLPSIHARAHELGLALCPAVTGPYLRLVMTDQQSAPDSVMSNGRAPSGSVTVAAAPLDDDAPTGFYLRVVDGVPWLRGYHAGPRHVWAPDDCFAFRIDGPPPEAGA